MQARHEVRVLLNDSLAGRLATLAVSGYRGSERWASARVAVTPVLHEEVAAEITLFRLPCGAWCSEGETTCFGDGVAICEQRDEDACFEWSDPVHCGSEAPFCSLGECRVTPIDECATGETRCAGPSAVQSCGQGDSDPTLEWLSAVDCADGETCSNGACHSGPPVSECVAGGAKCAADGVSTCADLNADGAAEWGPAVACGEGKTCEGGACIDPTACRDDCDAATCDGDTYRQCGNYDTDPCKELSPGTSCTAANACFAGSCAPDGCASTPIMCASPPASSCVDSHTLRVYDAEGSCDANGCHYASSDRECANCPFCDACAGVTCSSPPSVCFSAGGVCSSGSCAYAPTTGGGCDDGNACTENDTCSSGSCSGRPKACGTPPASECITSSTLRTYNATGSCSGGVCSYPHADVSCPNCPSCDACAGVTCSSPPSPSACYQATGTCSGGSCSYGYANGASCNDANSCTVNDRCASGVCSGTAMTCTTPEAPTCVDATTLRTYSASGTCTSGACVYPNTDRSCGRGCISGACIPDCGTIWCDVPTAGGPLPRARAVAVWTGTEMLIWGGCRSGGCYYAGARFNPATNTWAPIPATGAPRGFANAVAVWTGTEMLVWGGVGVGGVRNDGGRFNPATNTWSPIPPAGAPSARGSAVAVWTGAEMLVWGGESWPAGGWPYSYHSDGGRFDPATNTWSLLVTRGAPSARSNAVAVWTGTAMLVWGGGDCPLEPSGTSCRTHPFADGGRFNPGTATWSTIPSAGAPSARDGAVAVWTGTEMFVWGGDPNNSRGGRFDFASYTWSGLSSTGGPDTRDDAVAVWAGNEMIVWGGSDTFDGPSGGYFDDAWSYTPP